MATTMTLAELRDAVRQRADMVNSQFVTDAELNSYINQSYFELYDLLIQKYGNDYSVAAPYTLTTDGTNATFNLPADFYKLLGVDLALSYNPSSPEQSSWISLYPFMVSERNRYVYPNYQSWWGVSNLRYHLRGNTIWFTPLPAANQTVRLIYIPRMITLATDSDAVDGISGWTEYIIVDAAIKCLQKEESDPSVLFAQKQALIARIQSAAENRDPGHPLTVSETGRFNNGWLGGGFGGPEGGYW